MVNCDALAVYLHILSSLPKLDPGKVKEASDNWKQNNMPRAREGPMELTARVLEAHGIGLEELDAQMDWISFEPAEDIGDDASVGSNE